MPGPYLGNLQEAVASPPFRTYLDPSLMTVPDRRISQRT
jgi:hypothetical protein